MTSYLVYLLAMQNIFSGLNKNDRFRDVQLGVYNYFPQLEMIKSEKHFCRVNDAFTFNIVRKIKITIGAIIAESLNGKIIILSLMSNLLVR